MVKRVSTYGKGHAALVECLEKLESFKTSGSLRGERLPVGETHYVYAGQLEEPWRSQLMHSDLAGEVIYVVHSYSTPIAWVWTEARSLSQRLSTAGRRRSTRARCTRLESACVGSTRRIPPTAPILVSTMRATRFMVLGVTMAEYFLLTCGECDEPVKTSEKLKKYVHANERKKYDHAVTEVLSENLLVRSEKCRSKSSSRSITTTRSPRSRTRTTSRTS